MHRADSSFALVRPGGLLGRLNKSRRAAQVAIVTGEHGNRWHLREHCVANPGQPRVVINTDPAHPRPSAAGQPGQPNATSGACLADHTLIDAPGKQLQKASMRRQA